MSTHLAILNKLEDSLDVLDLGTMSFVASIALPSHPHELAVSRDGRALYASIYGDGVYGNNVHPGHEVYVIDVDSLTVRRVIDVAPHRGPHAMAEAPDGMLWVTCDNSSEVILVDPDRGTVVDVIAMGFHGGHFMTMTRDGATAFISNKDTAHLAVINCATRTIRARVVLDEGCEGLCLTPDERRLFVMSHMGSPLPNPTRPDHLSLYVVDTQSLDVTAQVSLPTLPRIAPDADHESRVSVTPDGASAIVTAFRWNTLAVIDTSSLEVRSTVLVDAEPMNIAYRSDDAGGAYVANHGDGIVSRLDLVTGTITDRWPSSPAGRPGRPEDLAFLVRS